MFFYSNASRDRTSYVNQLLLLLFCYGVLLLLFCM